ncbi:kinesin [Penicillium waksmanii]|uniref:kinesin n=1 Tax=Penicillium waksmanii TaxID=69791 RepID=UPI002547A6AD|nr:kinesin [Penicillium waksmanii]KAJ5975877.1 kinesin [Penicillium waksmanii]
MNIGRMASTICFGELNAGFKIGVNNAPINQIQLPPGKSTPQVPCSADSEGANLIPHIAAPERPDTPSEPLSTVPFLRDADFVDCGTLLEQVEEKCIVRPSRLALVGIGGVGKSQLAIEYSYRVRERAPNTWVFWVHASNAARFEQSYRVIAYQAKISGYRDPKACVVSLVTDWLQVEKRKWILILDHVDDDHFFHELQKNQAAHQQRPLGFLPCSSNGSIIITTRSRAVALRFVDERNLIEVNPMDSLDASALMNVKLGYQTEQGIATQDDIMNLTEALEFMPLAIVQAAAYIRHPASRCSADQYLEDFHSSDSEKLKLLEYEVGNIHRDMDAKNSILVTWSLSFEHIRQMRLSAADLLSLMSFFDRQGIPEAVLQRQIPQEQILGKKEKWKVTEWFYSMFYSRGSSSTVNPNSPEDSEKSGAANVVFDIQRDIMMLRDYCLVSIGQESSSFEMHRLVQLSMQKWLEANGELEKWKTVFVETLNSEFPHWANVGDWSFGRSLFPHIQSALSQRPLSKLALCSWASLLYKGYLYAEGTHLEEMAMESMNAKEELIDEILT